MVDVEADRDVVAWARYFWEKQGFPGGQYLALFASLGRVDRIITRGIEEILKPFALGVNRYFLLNTLMLTESGARPMNRLSWHMMIHPTTVTVVVDQLERDGLVARKPHPTDRRATLIEITPAGRALTREASQALATANFGLPSLKARDIENLTALLTTIRMATDDAKRDVRGRYGVPSTAADAQAD